MTRKELEQLLTPEEFDNFVTNIINNNITSYADIRNYFYSKFVLHDTPEGETYWYKIISRLEEGRGVKKFLKKDEILKTISDIENNDIVDYRSIAIDIISKVETEIREQGMDSGFNESHMDEMYDNLSTKVLPYIKNQYYTDNNDIESCEAQMQFTLEEGGKIEFIIEYCGNIRGYSVEDIRFVLE